MQIEKHVKSGNEIVSETIEVDAKEPLKEEIMDFVDCVKNRRKPKVSAIDGKRALEVALDITEMIDKAEMKT